VYELRRGYVCLFGKEREREVAFIKQGRSSGGFSFWRVRGGTRISRGRQIN